MSLHIISLFFKRPSTYIKSKRVSSKAIFAGQVFTAQNACTHSTPLFTSMHGHIFKPIAIVKGPSFGPSPCADPESFVREGPTLIFFWGERGSKNHQKVGNYRPASKVPLKWRFAGGPIMAHIECWLGSFVIYKGSGPVLLGNPINL